jgi:hypothetical protein
VEPRKKKKIYRVKILAVFSHCHVVLDGLVVSMLAIGSKVEGFKTGRGNLIFKGDKNPQHNFFVGEVKKSIPRRGMLKITAEYDRDISREKLTDLSRQFYPCFATRYVLVFARQLW